jgi:diaminopimelate epimerase
MEIDFLKMQGCGDDVVVASGARLPAEAPALFHQLARKILDRSFGVGGTAFLVLGEASEGMLPVRCFDPEGDEIPAGCHALRCVARYASDSGAVHANDFPLLCFGQKRRAQIIDSINIRLDMGMPFSVEKATEIRESVTESFTRSIEVGGRALTYTPISLGRPYAMFFVPDYSFPVRKTARTIADQPDFPDGTGIGFVQVYSREEMRLRSWEADGEGPGDECACAASAAVAAVVNGFTDRELFVHLRGGDVFVQWRESDNRIWLTGSARYVFTGTFDFMTGTGE